jgi:ABC-type sugar transport system permease subunit
MVEADLGLSKLPVVPGHQIAETVAAQDKGGDRYAIGDRFVTDVLGIFVFEATFQDNHYAQGAAISVIMLLVVPLVIIPYLVFSLRPEVEL